MKPSTYLLFAINYLGLASAASIVNPDDSLYPMEKRACFLTGEGYGNSKDPALNAARTACNSYFKGTYNKRETRVKCYSIGSNKQVKLTVGLTGPNAGSTRYISSEECYDGLSGRINSCPKGDDKTFGNWRYRADPNKGAC